jgi:hypothetical protein
MGHSEWKHITKGMFLTWKKLPDAQKGNKYAVENIFPGETLTRLPVRYTVLTVMM